jgi:hypothetical protein
MTGLDEMLGELREHVSLLGLVHQCHHALIHIHSDEIVIGHLYLGIDQRGADSVSSIRFHRLRPIGCKVATFYRNPTAPAANFTALRVIMGPRQQNLCCNDRPIFASSGQPKR